MFPRRSILSLSLASVLLACGASPAPRPAPTPPEPAPAPPPTRDQILAASDLPPLLAAPLPKDPLQVTIHRLSNGMTVYLSTDRETPRFTAWIAVRAGSRHDPADSTGLAHYLEHMLFKGTDQIGTTDYAIEKVDLDTIAGLYDDLRATTDDAARASILAAIDAATQRAARQAIPNELDQLYASLGADGVNAFTWHDMTVYLADLPSNRTAAWAAVEGERFTDPVFRLFYPELEIVYEEKNRSLDSAPRRVEEALHLALYPDHPYGTQPTIGRVEHLKTPAFRDMVDFYRHWYVPNNMAIVLAGDVDAEILPILERAFARFEPRPLPEPAPGSLAPRSGRTQVDLTAPGGNELSMAWRTVPAGHPDEAALEVMDLLTSDASAGILDIDLVLSQKLPRAWSATANYHEAGHFVLFGTARAGQDLTEVESLLLGVVAKLQAGEFAQADLDAVVLRAEMSEMSELEANPARVAKMAQAFLMHQPWPRAADHLARLRAVTDDDVLRVANQYLGDDFVVVRRHSGDYSPPKLTKPGITPIPIDPARRSGFADQIAAMPSTALAPRWLQPGTDYQRVDLASGPLVAVENPKNQLFSLRYEFDLGSRREPLLCLALDLMQRSGQQGFTALRLRKRLAELGTDITISCDVDATSLTLSGIDRNLVPSVALLDGWLRSASLDAGDLGRLVANQISRRADRVKEPHVLGLALDQYAARARDSEFLLAPSNRALTGARVGALARLLHALPDRRHRTEYFGPRSAADAATVVTLGRDHRKVAGPPPVAYRPTRGVRIFFTPTDLAQARIAIVLPQPPFDPADTPRSELYNSYVGGGFEGLVVQEIREARGLAYSASAGHQPGARRGDQAALRGSLQTQNDKVVEAVTTLLDLLRNPPMQPERLAKARASLAARYRSTRVSPRFVTSMVRMWDDLGLDHDPRPDYFAAHQTLGEADLAEFARRFASGDVIISIIGDRAHIDLGALAKLGRVEVVKPEQLFGY